MKVEESLMDWQSRVRLLKREANPLDGAMSVSRKDIKGAVEEIFNSLEDLRSKIAARRGFKQILGKQRLGSELGDFLAAENDEVFCCELASALYYYRHLHCSERSVKQYCPLLQINCV